MKHIILAVAVCLIIQLLPSGSVLAFQDRKPKLILDADTGNEIDDLYAIIRTLRQDKFDVVGLASAQWFHYLGDQNSVEASQKINEDLVKLLGRQDLPTPIGAQRPFGKPWGGEDPKDSPAAQFIIETVGELADGEQLHVVCIGASTNLATAIKLAPEIVPRIKAYVMAFEYDFETGAWNKSEFNVRRDLNAADFLLNQKGLELHIMSATTSRVLTFEQEDSFQRQAKMGKLGQYLTDRWKERFPDNKTWIMWDLALIEALLHPQWATEKRVVTPPENYQRKVWMYRTIEHEKMQDDFWKTAVEEN